MTYPLDPLDEDTEHGVDMRGLDRWYDDEVLFIVGSVAAFAVVVGAMLWDGLR